MVKNNFKVWWEDNKEYHRASVREDYNSNKEKRLAQMKEYVSNNKERVREYKKQWRLRNKGRGNASQAKRKAARLQQTPKWADLKAIRDFYNNCPDGYHVDHIIPLQGKNVRGLHVLENLQYLPAVENKRKSNKFS